MSEVTEHVGLLEDGPAWIPPVTQRVDPQLYVSLKGKQYATWPGVLDAATRSGLVSLTVTPLQLPAPDNGHTAVCLATAVFADGRRFADIGDASPANCSAQVATALLRMASTRSKGRVLRDAINVGDPEDEEPADGDRKPTQPVQQRAGPNGPNQTQSASAGARGASSTPAAPVCARKHAVPLQEVEYEQSMHRFGKPLCPACYQQLSDHAAAQAAALARGYDAALAGDAPAPAGMRVIPPGSENAGACQACGKTISLAELTASRPHGRILCTADLPAFVTTTRSAHNPAV